MANPRSQSLLLCAILKDIEVVGEPEKKRVSDYYAEIQVEGQVLRTEKKHGISNTKWQEEHQFWFEASSVISITIFRASKLRRFKIPKQPHVVGRCSGRVVDLIENGKFIRLLVMAGMRQLKSLIDTTLDLADSIGASIGPSIRMTLSLVTGPQDSFMKMVDADISRLEVTPLFSRESEEIDATVRFAQNGTVTAQTISPCIAPLGQALQGIVKLVDSLADAHPILKVSWTVLSSVYKAVKNQMDQDEYIKNLAESLREMIGVAQECPDLSTIPGTTNVIDDIGRTCLNVASLIQEYTTSRFLMGRTLKFQISDDMKSRIETGQRLCNDLMDKLKTRLSIATNKIAAGIQKEVKNIHDAQLKNAIHQWLSPIDTSTNYNEAREKYSQSTCSWLIKNHAFENWRNDGHELLYVYGPAGCGKTILCSSVIENLIEVCEASPSLAYAYFFFDGRGARKERNLYSNLIRSLVSQINDQCDGIPAPLVELYKRCKDGHQQPSIGALQDVLQDILNTFHRTYVVVDSLDECVERDKLLSWLEMTHRQQNSKLHLAVTSRPERGIHDHLCSLNPRCVSVTDESDNADIKLYLDQVLQTDPRLSRWKKKDRQNIKSVLLRKAQGMFRWVILQIAELRQCSDLDTLEKQLESLPKDLNETYDRILLRVQERDQSAVHNFLQWIAFSYRPLKLEELAEVAAVDWNAESGPKFELKRRYVDNRDILEKCSSLIAESEDRQAGALTVKLAHFSVKEYLLSEIIKKEGTRQFAIDEKLSHSTISRTCLVYLLQFDGAMVDETLIQGFPLAYYAAEDWMLHANSSGPVRIPTVSSLIIQFLRCGNAVANWIRIRDVEEDQRVFQWDRSEFGSCVYYASWAGFESEVRQLLESGADANLQGGYCGNALQAASLNGFETIVQILLERGADVNLKGGHYGTALQAASYRGNGTIVCTLLEKGASVNMQGGTYGNALQAASIEGHDTLVRILLENGADVNARGGEHDNALWAASFNEEETVVETLLGNGADISCLLSLGYGLPFAAAEGKEVLVRALLEGGADVDALEPPFGTALNSALSNCRAPNSIVQILLEHGADVNVQIDGHGNALHTACLRGFETTVRILLDNGADANALGGPYGNVLAAAAAGPSDSRALAIVKLLLDNGADVGTHGARALAVAKGLSWEVADFLRSLGVQELSKERKRATKR